MVVDFFAVELLAFAASAPADFFEGVFFVIFLEVFDDFFFVVDFAAVDFFEPDFFDVVFFLITFFTGDFFDVFIVVDFFLLDVFLLVVFFLDVLRDAGLRAGFFLDAPEAEVLLAVVFFRRVDFPADFLATIAALAVRGM